MSLVDKSLRKVASIISPKEIQNLPHPLEEKMEAAIKIEKIKTLLLNILMFVSDQSKLTFDKTYLLKGKEIRQVPNQLPYPSLSINGFNDWIYDKATETYHYWNNIINDWKSRDDWLSLRSGLINLFTRHLYMEKNEDGDLVYVGPPLTTEEDEATEDADYSQIIWVPLYFFNALGNKKDNIENWIKITIVELFLKD